MMASPHIFTLNVKASFIPTDEKQEWSDPQRLLKFVETLESPKVLILNLDHLEEPFEYFERLARSHPDSVWIMDKPPSPDQKFILSFPQFFGFLNATDDENRKMVARSLERISEVNQEVDLLRLLRSENTKLKANLEHLTKSKKTTGRKTAGKAHLRMKTLENSLLEILKAKSVREIESALKKTLSKLLPLDYARVIFSQQSSLIDRAPDSYLVKVPLMISESNSKGWLILGLSRKKSIPEKDLDLLEEIAEIASLSVNRVLQLEDSESLKQQWDATFDAISDPLCLVDERMCILRTNKAFSNAVAKGFNEVIGENSLKIFFKNNPEVWKTPPPLNLKIQVHNKLDGKFYSLVIHDLKFAIDNKNINLLLIKDITDQMKLEKQIREKSKLVELGTIGSSIAHELNNPLAGMLSYLQLLLMDVEKDSEFYEDLKEMESATLRCKDIVQNLLGFSRKQSIDRKALIDLNDLALKAVQLVELKSRFKKVNIEVKTLEKKASFHGDQNSLVQALTHILTNSVEALEERISIEKNFMARINIVLMEKDHVYLIHITDNGPGISDKHLPLVINPLFTTKTGTYHAGLGLTVAYSIFSEHDGTLEIESRPGQGVTAIISLPRPEFVGSSRGIDTQI